MGELWAGIPIWQRVALAALFVYATVNALAAIADAPDAGFGVRLFSGHGMLFYLVSAVFGRRLLADPPAT